MGCNCGKARQNVRYEATFSNGSPKQTYDTVAAAQAALKSAGGGTFKAVKA